MQIGLCKITPTVRVLDKFLHRTQPSAAPRPNAVACPHTTLIPRWDQAADMGHEARVSSYTCEACQQHFTAQQGQRLRQTEAERVRQLAR